MTRAVQTALTALEPLLEGDGPRCLELKLNAREKKNWGGARVN